VVEGDFALLGPVGEGHDGVGGPFLRVQVVDVVPHPLYRRHLGFDLDQLAGKPLENVCELKDIREHKSGQCS